MSEEEKATKPITDEIATVPKDIDIFTGWLDRRDNQDPVVLYESNGKGLKLYDDVDRDAHAGSVLQTRYLAVIGKEWLIEPAGGKSKKGRRPVVTREQLIANFVEKALYAINFDQARQEILQAILYGFYPAEIMWKYTVIDGRTAIVPARILGKHPKRFTFALDRSLRLLTPNNQWDGEPVPDRKFIVFTYGSSDDPYGKGLGQKLWWPVWFKKNGIKFWAVFLEKFGMPTGVGKYPPGTVKEQQDKLLSAIGAIHSETGIAIPDNMIIDLLEATRSGKVTYESFPEYMDRQISKAVLGQTASTEGTPGKLGNEEVQGEVRADILKADADLLCECLNNSLIKWIVDFNFPGVTEYPHIWIRTKEEGDLKPLADRDETLVNKIGLPVGKKYFYEKYGIPEPVEGEDLVVPETERAGEQVEQEPGEFSEKGRAGFGQEDIDNLSTQGAIASQEAISALLDPVVDMIEDASSFEEIGEKLYGLYPDMDSKEFHELLTRAMFAAGLTGYAASQEDEE